MFHRPRNRALANDEEDFSKEQSKYLSRHQDRPILGRAGMEEVNSRERRGNNDYFLAGELPRRQEGSPSRGRG
jgi:hypothetical protein